MVETGPAHGFEQRERGGIAVARIIWIGVGFAVFVGISLAAMFFFYSGSTTTVPMPLPRPFPNPVLEQTPLVDLQTLQQKQKAQLEGYAWVDRGRGLARIPVSEAMNIIAQRGADAFNPIANQALEPQGAKGGQP